MSSSGGSLSPNRLLFVEDEADVAGPIKRSLEEEGYLVDWTKNEEEGLTEALAGPYDVLIVDWRLPGMDGRTLVERLRREGTPTPVLMLTALQDVDHRVAGLDAGADELDKAVLLRGTSGPPPCPRGSCRARGHVP